MTQAEKIQSEYFNEEWVMEFTGYSRKTIQCYRSNGDKRIPPSKKIGSKWMYPVKDFRLWLEKLPVQR